MIYLLTAVIVLSGLHPLSAQLPWWKWPKKWADSKFHKATADRQAPAMLGKTLEGENRTIQDYEGRVLLLNFWAVWCSPCLVELPHLLDIKRTYESEGLDILAINVLGTKPKLLRYLQKHPVELTHLHDEDKVAKTYGVINLPTIVLVDGEGIILNRWEGADLQQVKRELALYFEELRRLPTD